MPIALHPANPHYFQYRGRATVLITSGEHYGSVINPDFDYTRYLDEIASKHLNYTRACTGTYVEFPGYFDIADNNQAPATGRLLCPWLRSNTPGYINGGNKFDLTQWDPAYFARWHDFLEQAESRGIIIEVSLFCPYYNDELWKYSPLHSINNINGIGVIGSTQANTMDNGKLLAVQEALVRKIVTELNRHENLFYEICNEPYHAGVTIDWQNRIAEVIAESQAALPHQHLIAQNIANQSAMISRPNPKVSVFNFHYCRPPDAVGWNYHLNKVIGLDETGTDGILDITYRMQGWDFMLAGGGLYNNLDYSFTTDHPDGSALVPNSSPGGGSAALRTQLGILKQFMDSLDFVQMGPDGETVVRIVPPGPTTRVLSNPGTQYAIYLKGGPQADLMMNLPAGTYEAEWVDTVTGQTAKTETFSHEGSYRTLVSPSYSDDFALRLTNTDRVAG